LSERFTESVVEDAALAWLSERTTVLEPENWQRLKERVNAREKGELRLKIDAGVKAAVAAALEEHRRSGQLVAVLRAGRVVVAPAEPQLSAEALALREGPPP
jgi:hypothetical protein